MDWEDFLSLGDLWGSGDIDFSQISSDLSDLWGSGDFDFSKVQNAFSDADIEALANLGSGTYNSMDDAIAAYAEQSGQDLATAQQKFAASGLKLEDLPGVSKFSTIKNVMKSFGLTDEAGKINPAALLGLTGLLSLAGQGSRGTPPPSGYQGSVPKYTAVRERVDIPQDPNRRPGAGGRRYFSDVTYAPEADVAAAREAAKAQAEALKPALYPTPQVKAPEQEKVTEVIKPSLASGVAQLLPVPKYDTKGDVVNSGFTQNRIGFGGVRAPEGYFFGPADELIPDSVKTFNQYETWKNQRAGKEGQPNKASIGDTPEDFGYTNEQFGDLLLRQSVLTPGEIYPSPSPALPPKVEPDATAIPAARGGLMSMAKGRYLNGSTDGMEDKIPATISGKQPARLSHGEFVVPADVVSHLGNGNSNAGAQRLYDMMDRVRKARTGNPKQGKQINPNKYLPK